MIKEALLKQCFLFVNDKLTIIETIMTESQKALEQESKSSAGDKHETGRAMLHLEMEKASQQLEVANRMKETLQRIHLNSVSEKVKLGSLVTTDQGTYFLSISAGQLEVTGKNYYAVSSSSPIGELLIGKETGAMVTLGAKAIKILSIS
jgi:transcription elongation GreA/GreB family factor